MISDDMYNRICSLFFSEEIRLNNNLVECENFIFRYHPTDPDPYIKLIQAQTEKAYFDRYVFSLLSWFDKFTESG